MKVLDRAGLQTLSECIYKGFTRAEVGENLIASVDGLVTLYSSMNTTMTNKFAAVDTSLAKKADKDEVEHVNVLIEALNTNKAEADEVNSELSTIRQILSGAASTTDVSKSLGYLRDKHDAEMRVMGYHLGLPEYTVEQMFAWDPATESAFQMYKDDTGLEVWPRVDMHAVANAGQMFYGCNALTEVYEIAMPACETAAHMFNSCTALTSVAPVKLGNSVTAVNGMFYGCTELEEVTIESVSATNVAANSMFQNCTKLKRADLGSMQIGNGDVMFYGCAELEELTIAPCNLTSCNMMFKNCSKLRKINGGLSFRFIVDMQDCFHSCKALAYAYLMNLGNISGDTLDLSALENWGNEDEATGGVPGAIRQLGLSVNVLSTLTTSAKTLKLSASLLARLQSKGLDSLILAKGWTIVT